VGTLQSNDDTIVVTLRIGGYDVKSVLVDQGSSVKIMYLDLYKGLKLKPEDLACYDSTFVGFDGKTVIPRGQIRLPIQIGLKVVEMDFIVVDAYSPYCGEALASCHGGCFLHFALKSKVSFKGSG